MVNGLREYLAGLNDGPGGSNLPKGACAECGTILYGELLKVCGRVFCSQECADDFKDGRR